MSQPELKQALAAAVDRKDDALVEDLIRRGADVNAKFDNDFTLLHIAVQSGDMYMARLLVLNGADIHMPNARGKTPLDLAANIDKIRDENGIGGERFYITLTTALSQRNARRIKAQRHLRYRPAA